LREKLGFSPQRARPDTGAARQLVDRLSRTQRIARVCPSRDACDYKTRQQCIGKVLCGVNTNVCLATEQGILKRADKAGLVLICVGSWRRAVSSGVHPHDLDYEVWVDCLKSLLYESCLCQR
jgi:hypothetical protein